MNHTLAFSQPLFSAHRSPLTANLSVVSFCGRPLLLSSRPLPRALSRHSLLPLVAQQQEQAQQQQQQPNLPPPAPLASAFPTPRLSVEDFFAQSLGQWRSQRSSHNLAFAHFEAIRSDIEIAPLDGLHHQGPPLPLDAHPEVVEICQRHSLQISEITLAVRMSWEGYSDWDEDQEDGGKALKGSTVLVVVRDDEDQQDGGSQRDTGLLYRSQGYTEQVPAVGRWWMNNGDGCFVLVTPYEMASAEERIWFVTKDMRMRLSMIRTQTGRGVVTASMSTEIRELPKQKQ